LELLPDKDRFHFEFKFTILDCELTKGKREFSLTFSPDPSVISQQISADDGFEILMTSIQKEGERERKKEGQKERKKAKKKERKKEY
jgi:hypothetical protein